MKTDVPDYIEAAKIAKEIHSVLESIKDRQKLSSSDDPVGRWVEKNFPAFRDAFIKLVPEIAVVVNNWYFSSDIRFCKYTLTTGCTIREMLDSSGKPQWYRSLGHPSEFFFHLKDIEPSWMTEERIPETDFMKLYKKMTGIE